MVKFIDYANVQNQDLLEFCTSALNIPDCEVYISRDDKLLQKFDTKKYQINALLHQSAIPHVYNLIIRNKPSDPIESILAHELVHLKQYELKELSLNINKKEFVWHNVVFTNDCEYMDRPWEKEAFRQQSKLLCAYRKAKRVAKRALRKK